MYVRVNNYVNYYIDEGVVLSIGVKWDNSTVFRVKKDGKFYYYRSVESALKKVGVI